MEDRKAKDPEITLAGLKRQIRFLLERLDIERQKSDCILAQARYWKEAADGEEQVVYDLNRRLAQLQRDYNLLTGLFGVEDVTRERDELRSALARQSRTRKGISRMLRDGVMERLELRIRIRELEEELAEAKEEQ